MAHLQLTLSGTVPDEGTFQLGKNMSGVFIKVFFNRVGDSSHFAEPQHLIRLSDAPQVLRGAPSTSPEEASMRQLCFLAKSTLELDGNSREDQISQGHIPVSQLVRAITRAREQVATSTAFTMPVQLYDRSMTEQDGSSVMRGTLALQVHLTPDLALPQDAPEFTSELHQQLEDTIKPLFAKFASAPADYNLTPVFPVASRMRVPFYVTNVLTIPAVFFAWVKPWVTRAPAVIPLYVAQYNALLTAALAFHASDRAAFQGVLEAVLNATAASVHWHDVHMAGRIIATMFMMRATAMNYESDRTIADRLSERFKISRNGDNAGDCEDLAKEIALAVDLFLDIGDAGELHDDELLVLVYRLACCYVWTMLSGMVSAPSLGADQEGEPKFSNHIYACAIPRAHFLKMLRDGVAPATIEQLRGELYTRQAPLAHGGEDQLQLMVLEGTGWANPFHNAWSAYVDPDAEDLHRTTVNRQRATMRVARGFFAKHKELLQHQFKPVIQQNALEVQSRDPMRGFPSVDAFSSFYKYVLSCWVDLRRFGINHYCDFLVCDLPTRTYGVDFRQWVGQHDTVRLFPQIQIESDAQLATILWALSCQHPFVPPNAAPIVVARGSVNSSSPHYTPFAHPQAALFTPRVFFALRARSEAALSAPHVQRALQAALTDPNLMVQRVESTEVKFPGEKRNRLYTAELRFFV